MAAGERAVVGIFTALTGLAVVGGPVVGGAVTEGIAWQWIFWINVPIGVVLIPLASTGSARASGSAAGLDLIGLALATAGMFGVVWGLVRASDAGWSSAEVLGDARRSAPSLGAAFVAGRSAHPEPMLPMQLFRIRDFSAGNAAMLLLTASLFGAVFLMAQYLQISLGYSPLGAGLRFLPWTGTLFVVAPLAGSPGGRLGARPLLAAGLPCRAPGLGWVALQHARRAARTRHSVVALVIAGCGTSMAMPSGQNLGHELGSAELPRARRRARSTRSANWVACSASRCCRRCSRRRAATPRPTRSGTASRRRSGVAAGLAIAGVVRRRCFAGRPAHAEPTVAPTASAPADVARCA